MSAPFASNSSTMAASVPCCEASHKAFPFAREERYYTYGYWSTKRVAVCCGVLQCVAVCCSVLRCVAVRCSVLQHIVAYMRPFEHQVCGSVLQRVARVVVCYTKLPRVAMCGSVREALTLSSSYLFAKPLSICEGKSVLISFTDTRACSHAMHASHHMPTSQQFSRETFPFPCLFSLSPYTHAQEIGRASCRERV